MDKETQQIISLIAEIQISAIQNLREKETQTNASIAHEMMAKLLEINPDSEQPISELISQAIDKRLDLYQSVKEMPQLIKTLDEYQILLCSHILFKMEDTWIQENQQGVLNAWSILTELQNRFHPELTLLWSK